MWHVKSLLWCLAHICFVRVSESQSESPAKALGKENIRNTSTSQEVGWGSVVFGKIQWQRLWWEGRGRRRIWNSTEVDTANFDWAVGQEIEKDIGVWPMLSWPHWWIWISSWFSFYSLYDIFSFFVVAVFLIEQGGGQVQSTLLTQSSLIFNIHVTSVKILQCFML